MSKDIVGKSWQTKAALINDISTRSIESLALIDDSNEHILNGLDVTWYAPRERRDDHTRYDMVAIHTDKELGQFVDRYYYEPTRPLKRFVFCNFTHQFAQSLHLKNTHALHRSFELMLCDQPGDLCRWPGVVEDIRRLSFRVGAEVRWCRWCDAYLNRPDLVRLALEMQREHSTKPMTIFQKSENPKFTAGAYVRIGRLVLKNVFSGDPIFYTRATLGGLTIEKENYL